MSGIRDNELRNSVRRAIVDIGVILSGIECNCAACLDLIGVRTNDQFDFSLGNSQILCGAVFVVYAGIVTARFENAIKAFKLMQGANHKS